MTEKPMDWRDQMLLSYDLKMVARADDLLPEILTLLGPKAQAEPKNVKVSVVQAAQMYLTLKGFYDQVPSRKELREFLEGVEKTAGKLAGLLRNADLIKIAALYMYGLPEKEAWALRSGGRSLFVDLARMISLMAQGARESLLLSGGAAGRKAWTLPPKRELALECLQIFDEYRPGEAKTTEGGDFRAFVGYVYEIATGERDADLEKPVKEAVKLAHAHGIPDHKLAELINPQLKDVRSLIGLRRPTP